jgi:hypothetical protein
MTYVLARAVPLRVETDVLGRPHRLIWQGKAHTVLLITNWWVFQYRWWLDEAQIWWDYFEVLTDSRRLLTLFRDVPSGHWFLYELVD